MATVDHLSDVQFANPRKLAAKYWDPNLKDPETLRRWSGPGYIANLTGKIRQEGMQEPVQLTTHRAGQGQTMPYVYDGHHRLIVAMDLGMKRVPYRWVSGKPGEQ